MKPTRLCADAHKRFAWLLALVLLLPIAQGLAAWHVLSHVQTAETDTAVQTHLAGPNLCDVCLAAMAITGGAPPIRSLDHLKIAAPATPPRVLWVHAFFDFTTPAYESRAPPFAPI